jgi:hypothetical protein
MRGNVVEESDLNGIFLFNNHENTKSGMDSILSTFLRQDQQDIPDIFILSHFPDGSEKTQSAFSGKLISLVSTIYLGIFL